MKSERLRSDIVDYLQKTGLKPYRLADQAGIPRVTIYRLLAGKQTGVHIDTADRICDVIYFRKKREEK